MTSPASTPDSSSAGGGAFAVFLAQPEAEWENTCLVSLFSQHLSGSISRPSIPAKEDTKIETFQTKKLNFLDHLDELVVDRLMDPANSAIPAFDWLFLGLWRKAQQAKSKLAIIKAKHPDHPEAQSRCTERTEKLTRAQILALDYAAIILHPDTSAGFPQPKIAIESGASWLCSYLLGLDPQGNGNSPVPLDKSITHDFTLFFQEFCQRQYDSGELNIFLSGISRGFLGLVRTKSLVDHRDIQRAFTGMFQLLEFPHVISVLASLPNFNPSANTTAKLIELNSVLGPFFARSTAFPDTDMRLLDAYFPPNAMTAAMESNPDHQAHHDGFPIGSRNPGDVGTSQGLLRQLSSGIQKQLTNMTMLFIKGGDGSKESMLGFFGNVLSLNVKRAQMQVDRRLVSGDGIFENMRAVLLQLLDPVMDSAYSKIHLIDLDYFKYATRFDIKGDTRINADQHQADAYEAEWRADHPELPKPNFISEIFYLSLYTHHLGLIASLRMYNDLMKQMQELERQMKRFASTPSHPSFIQAQEHRDKMIAFKLCMDVHLLDPASVAKTIQFYNLAIVWLVRASLSSSSMISYSATGPLSKERDSISWQSIVRGNSPEGTPLFPLANVPMIFSTLPEWILEDISEFYIFICRMNPRLLEHEPNQELVTFVMLALCNPQFIKNPYMKAKLVEILFFFTMPLYRYANGESHGYLDQVFISHSFAREHLIESLVTFYADAEKTGGHTQFYDKFNIRYHISQIFKSAFKHQHFLDKMFVESQNVEKFVRFVALLMNDTTFLLDESITKLREIQILEAKLEVPLSTNASADDVKQRQEDETTLAGLERQASSYLSLGNETVFMLNYLTENTSIVSGFMVSEIVERLAAMLNFNLNSLVGPKCTELKVKSPEKYQFNPKKLLRDIIGIYVHLAHRDEFILATAKDTRSYNKALFIKAASILSKNGLLNTQEAEILVEFVDKVETRIASEANAEEELGDIPDEFLDPVLYTLMDDPVILPTSNVTLDLSTVKTHLLSDPHDPFNRQPLSIGQVIPNTELKERIRQWKLSKRSA